MSDRFPDSHSAVPLSESEDLSLNGGHLGDETCGNPKYFSHGYLNIFA